MSLEFKLEMPLRDFTLDISGNYENQTTAVFGPSGSGKTTFLKLIAGIIQPQSGKIKLSGRTLTDTSTRTHVKPEKRGIGFVFQEKLLFPHMTVRQNLCFGLRYAEKRGKKQPLDIDAVADLLDLSSVLKSRPDRISGGEQQRAAIGRALLCAPDLLLLDEPFNAVDNLLRDSILMYLNRLRAQLSIPMIVVSHDLPDLQKLTDTVQLIKNGRSEGYGKISDYLVKPEIFPQRRA